MQHLSKRYRYKPGVTEFLPAKTTLLSYSRLGWLNGSVQAMVATALIGGPEARVVH